MIRQLVVFLLHSLVFAMLLSVGLRTSIADVRAVLARRDLIARTVLMANLVVPILAILVTAWLSRQPLAKGLILIMAICPGAPLVLGRFKNQEHAPTVLLAAISLVAVVTVPLWTAIFERLYTTHLEISAGQVALLTLRGLLLPLGLGVVIRQLRPKAADFLRPSQRCSTRWRSARPSSWWWSWLAAFCATSTSPRCSPW
jgi:BASS family bile acid:Na+ symporter